MATPVSWPPVTSQGQHMSPQRTIVIVGAGFSGTLVAVNLLRSQHWATTRIVLVERSAGVARGKAYADRDSPYLLNVPAGRMSADPSSPLDFLSFARHRIAVAPARDSALVRPDARHSPH